MIFVWDEHTHADACMYVCMYIYIYAYTTSTIHIYYYLTCTLHSARVSFGALSLSHTLCHTNTHTWIHKYKPAFICLRDEHIHEHIHLDIFVYINCVMYIIYIHTNICICHDIHIINTCESIWRFWTHSLYTVNVSHTYIHIYRHSCMYDSKANIFKQDFRDRANVTMIHVFMWMYV
jgi:hypothetical protein